MANNDKYNAIYHKTLNTRYHITLATVLAMIIVVSGICGFIYAGIPIRQELKEILLLIIGALIASYGKVMDYWFANSQRENAILQKIGSEEEDKNAANR